MKNQLNIGQLVIYRLKDSDIELLNNVGSNKQKCLPGIIVSKSGDDLFNLKLFLDGQVPDMWYTSVKVGLSEGEFITVQDDIERKECISQLDDILEFIDKSKSEISDMKECLNGNMDLNTLASKIFSKSENEDEDSPEKNDQIKPQDKKGAPLNEQVIDDLSFFDEKDPNDNTSSVFARDLKNTDISNMPDAENIPTEVANTTDTTQVSEALLTDIKRTETTGTTVTETYAVKSDPRTVAAQKPFDPVLGQ